MQSAAQFIICAASFQVFFFTKTCHSNTNGLCWCTFRIIEGLFKHMHAILNARKYKSQRTFLWSVSYSAIDSAAGVRQPSGVCRCVINHMAFYLLTTHSPPQTPTQAHQPTHAQTCTHAHTPTRSCFHPVSKAAAAFWRYSDWRTHNQGQITTIPQLVLHQSDNSGWMQSAAEPIWDRETTSQSQQVPASKAVRDRNKPIRV